MLGGQRVNGVHVDATPHGQRRQLAEYLPDGRHRDLGDLREHARHQRRESRVLRLQRRQHHAGGERDDRIQQLRLSERGDGDGRHGAAPLRVAAPHLQEQRVQRRQLQRRRGATERVLEQRAVGGEEGGDGAVAATEDLEKGVEIEEKDEETLSVRRRLRRDLEGVPVEGGQFGVYVRDGEKDDCRRGRPASSPFCGEPCDDRAASEPCCTRCRAACCG